MRIVEKADGLYVTGEGLLIPCKDLKEAKKIIGKEKANICRPCLYTDVCLNSTGADSQKCKEVPERPKIEALAIVKQSLISFPDNKSQRKLNWLKCDGCVAINVCPTKIKRDSIECKNIEATAKIEDKGW